MPITHVPVTSTVAEDPPAGGVGPTEWRAAHVGEVVLSVTATLTSAQIKALFTTPVQLVAAPGAGKVIVPLGFAASYHAGTTPYTDNGGRQQIYPSGSIADTWTFFNGAGLWDQATDQLASTISTGSGAFAAAGFANKALMIANDTANPTLGDGTLKVDVLYYVLTL